MASPFASDAVLASIRLRAKLPAADPVWSDANLLLTVNAELQSWGAPFLMAEFAEFLVTYQDVPTAANVSTYQIPGEAVGGVLREIQAIDQSQNIWQMQQIDIKELGPVFFVAGGVPSAFYVQGDGIVLTVVPSNDQWTLRMVYARRPSTVVLASDCAQITGIVGTAVTCAGGFPTAFINGTTMDFVHGGSSFLPFRGAVTMPTPVGTTATFASVPTGLAVGDWLCLRNESPFAQIPADMQPVLAQRVVAVVLRAEADDKAAVEWQAFLEMESNMRRLLAPRVQGSLKGLRGMLNRRGIGRGGWGF